MRLSSTICCNALAALSLALVLSAPGAHASGISVLHAFAGLPGDGEQPEGDLTADSAGNLYGTTRDGGNKGCGHYGCGTVFKVAPDGTETVLFQFHGKSDGGLPAAGLIMDSAGNLFGTTETGGLSPPCRGGCGTVFEIDQQGKEKVFYSFPGGSDGLDPVASLVFDQNGNLYGTTSFGGNLSCNVIGCGVAFKLNAKGKETVLHAFAGGSDGAFPSARLWIDPTGNLFGTTADGGGSTNCTGGCGTVFEIDSHGNETVLYSFSGGSDGAHPYAGLIADSSGNLYGTTAEKGDSNCGCGTVFEIPAGGGSAIVLHSFTGGTDGANSYADLVADASGNLYGTTELGGGGSCRQGAGCGTVFEVTSGHSETVLHAFGTKSDGRYPLAGVIMDQSGNIFGTAAGGGSGCANGEHYGCGTVFELGK